MQRRRKSGFVTCILSYISRSKREFAMKLIRGLWFHRNQLYHIEALYTSMEVVVFVFVRRFLSHRLDALSAARPSSVR